MSKYIYLKMCETYLIPWYHTAPECNVYKYLRVRFPCFSFEIVQSGRGRNRIPTRRICTSEGNFIVWTIVEEEHIIDYYKGISAIVVTPPAAAA